LSNKPDGKTPSEAAAVRNVRSTAEAPRKSELVKLRYFTGLTIAEAAAAMGISHATAERYWAYSRLKLYQWMNGPDAPSENK